MEAFSFARLERAPTSRRLRPERKRQRKPGTSDFSSAKIFFISYKPGTTGFCVGWGKHVGSAEIRWCFTRYETRGSCGRSVPQQISVVGYDDLGVKTTPPMTTIRVDLDEVGRLALEALYRRIEGMQVKAGQTIVPVELVVRGSTASREMLPERSVLD